MLTNVTLVVTPTPDIVIVNESLALHRTCISCLMSVADLKKSL